MVDSSLEKLDQEGEILCHTINRQALRPILVLTGQLSLTPRLIDRLKLLA